MDGGLDTKTEGVSATAPSSLPDYLVNTYTWAYLTPASLVLLDNPVVVSAILWGNLSRLVRAACAEFKPGQRILQAANVYGHLSQALAEVVGPEGRLELIDIAPLQVEHARRKLAAYPQARVRVADASAPGGGFYDGICCFFLLHEIPDTTKEAVVNGLLASVPVGGKVVFFDYHRPSPWHPLQGVMRMVFRYLEPFAFGLINSEIRSFARRDEAFSWSKETYFGGLYQKVIAVRKA